MKKHKLSMLLIMSSAFLSFYLSAIGATFANTTVTVEKPVHVTTAEGSDVFLDAGKYTLDAAQEWLRITPSGGNAVDALLLEAHTGKHEESLTDPLAISATGIEPDSHHLVLLLPGGKSLEATGTYSGIRSRGRLSRLSIQRLRTLAASKRRTSRTEFVTPSMGGSGGKRSYNLDCGNQAVLVGAMYKSGLWLDALGIICQRINPQTGALGDEFTRNPIGGTGGRARIARCNDENVVQGARGISGQFVNRIVFFCSRWDPAKKKPVFSRSGRCRKGSDRCTGFGGSGGSPSDMFFCPNGKVGKALRGKYGSYIDSVSFVCDEWNR